MRFKVVASACLVVLMGGGWTSAQATDLSNGVFIAHAPSSLQYTNSPPTGSWCGAYAQYATIDSCSEQINEVDTQGAVVWYVLSAWTESKQWCGAQFGLGDYDTNDFAIWDHGACFPSGGLTIPTSGWPGPNEGIALTTTDENWEGNFVPLYWFAGYAYGEDVVPIGPDPDSDFAGWARCEDQEETAAVALGGLGLLTDGIYACPEGELDNSGGIEDVAQVDGVEGNGGTEPEDLDLEFGETQWIDLSGDDFGGGDPPDVHLLPSNGTEIVLEMTLNGFYATPDTIDGKSYYHISLPGESISEEAGTPALPFASRSLIIPDDQRMICSIDSSSYVDLPRMPIAPSKGPLLVGVDPNTVPYQFGSAYDSDSLYPAAPVVLGSPYILRDFRGMVVSLNAFQALPASDSLRVYTHMVIEISPSGLDSVNVLERVGLPEHVDPQFALLYKNHFLNYDDLGARDYVPAPECGKLLVIVSDSQDYDFRESMAPYVEWKRQRGLPTDMVGVSDIAGSPPDTTLIYDYILDRYLDPDDPIAYVLLVGDWAQMPSKYAPVHGLWVAALSDPLYSLLSGDDPYPDVFVGRFSAHSIAQVNTQVLRTIRYERDTGAGIQSESWLGRAFGMAHVSLLAPPPLTNRGWMVSHLEALESFGYDTTSYYGPPGAAWPVSEAVNDGIGLFLASNHGAWNGWPLAFPDFKIREVNLLTNSNRLPLIHAACCDLGQFSCDTCFAESWMWATHDGEPTGAIAVYMATRGLAQYGPQWAQQETVRLLTQGEMYSVGGLSYNGVCLELDKLPTDGVYDFLGWTIFGDPSLVFRTAAPTPMAVSHSGALYPDQDEYAVTVEDGAGARCTLYADGTIYGSVVAGESGTAAIPLDPVPTWPTTLTLTVTGSNSVTYQGRVHPACIVLPDSTGHFATIADAVVGAIDGTIIELGEGTFTGPGNREIECLGKGVTIRSQDGDPSACVIECGGDEDSGYWWLRYEAEPPSVLRIEGISIRGARAIIPGSAVFSDGDLEVANCMLEGNGGSSLGGAIYCNGSSTITGSWFEDNSAEYAGGAACLIGGAARLERCTFVSNTAVHEGGAVDIGGSLTMAECTIVGNQAFVGAGISLNSAEATVERTIIAQNLGPGAAVEEAVEESAANMVCCDVWDNDGGDWVGAIAGQESGTGNMSEDPVFCTGENSPERPYSLDVTSPCLWGNNH